MRAGKKKTKIAVILFTVAALVLCTPVFAYAGDDYPAKYKNAALDAMADEWNFYNREGTSFVAWCLNSRNGVAFHNWYGGRQWGHAKNWGVTARALGCAVDMNPVRGCVYWTTAGTYGQVAWVSAVEGSKVRIEAYNYAGNGAYYEQLVDIGSASGYIHIKDMPVAAPKPEPVMGSPISGSTQTIRDGDYHIVTTIDMYQCLDIVGPSKENGANAQIWGSADSERQVFTVKYVGNGFYEIMHKYSGKYLDVEGVSRANQANVHQWEHTGAENQQWVIRLTDDGASYTIQSRGSGFNLDMADGKVTNGTNVQMYLAHGGPAQRWLFIPWGNSVGRTISDGEYQIFSKTASDKVLSAAGDGALPAGNVQLGADKGNKNQVYKVTWLGNGYYSIANKNSGLLLDVAGGLLPIGTNVQLWKDNGGDAQKWIIKQSSSGYYNIISKFSGLYLDLALGKTADGTNIHMWQGDGTVSQEWSFVEWTESAAPSTPSAPSEPSVPVTPSEPSGCEPSVPVTSNSPSEPSVPVTPSTPSGPSVPITPSEPSGSDTPVTPSSPFEPSGPGGDETSTANTK